MTVKEALKRIRLYLGEDVTAVACRDYTTEFAFFIVPPE